MSPIHARPRSALSDALADLVGPPRCAGCRSAGAILCRRCSTLLRAADERPPPPGIDRVIAAYSYEGPARSLVLDLKLRAVRAAASPLSNGLVRSSRRTGVSGSVVTWVPGRPVSVRARGFDHAELIARRFAPVLGLPCRPLLCRRGSSLDQAGLSAAGRWENLVGVFVARTCGGGVVLVDDLVTTGATAGACAVALRAAGASGVELAAACSA